jgi:hypothetical protein
LFQDVSDIFYVRQVKEAIRLFFEQRGAIVIHTIIASAHQILAVRSQPASWTSM